MAQPCAASAGGELQMRAQRRVHYTTGLLVILLLSTLAGATLANTIYVDDDCPCPTPNGSPACPYCRIQDAINVAVAADVVQVLPGTYTENLNFRGKRITVTSTDPLAPAVVAATVIDGRALGSVVSFASGEGRDSILQGFTVTNGDALSGGGVYCYQCSPTIANNVITGNGSEYCHGGGICCDFVSAPLIAGNRIEGNGAAKGGGIYCADYSWPEIRDNTIADNSADFGGGAYCISSSASFARNIVRGNVAGIGGGIYCTNTCYPQITNTIVAGNSASLSGGVRCYSGCMADLDNCTVADNDDTGVAVGTNSSVTMANCIVRDEIAADGSSLLNVDHSDVCTPDQVPWPGDGNICADPQFVDAANGDYHLRFGSPCIDAGQNAGAPTDDIDGDVRPWPPAGTVDMGADEWVGSWIELHLAGGCWHLISFPCTPVNSDPWELLDELRPPNQPLDLLSGNLHRYDHDQQKYATYLRFVPGEFGPIVAGDGYWLYVFEDVTIHYAAECAGDPQDVILSSAGWHLKGSPHATDTPIADITLCREGPECHPFADVINTWMQDPLVRYGCATGGYHNTGLLPTDDDDSLRAFHGYWLYTFVDGVTMEVPAE
jgi:hypothetical protein